MSGNKRAKKQNNKSIIDGILTVLEYIVGTVTALLVTILLVFSLYVLWDMFYSDKTAFISWDLLRYRPNVEEGEEPTFDELRAINEDVAGWLTIYDTNIDYPILQGKDDMEYLNMSGVNARYIKIFVNGTSAGPWTSLEEVKFYVQ